MSKPTLAVVFHRFGPYHRTRIESLVNYFDVVALELSSRTAEYAWEPIEISDACRRVVICEDVDSRSLSVKQIYDRLDRVLHSLSVDAAAINGWSDNGALATLRWCGKHGVPAIVMSESNRVDFNRRPLREFIKRCLVGNSASGLVGGSLARDYLHHLGMPVERIFDGYDAIDNDHFAPPRDVSREVIRRELGFPRSYFLASNRFIEKKNLPRLVEAYASYRQGGRKVIRPQATGSERLSTSSQARQVTVGEPDSGPWDLVLLGDGPEKESIVRQVQRLGLTDAVHFPGFRQYDELPTYYWGAGAFVHASTTEQWGLVINEAMAAGLPVIASSRCGSTTDLVIDSKTGFVFDPTDIQRLTDRMIRVAGDESIRTQMSVAASRHIANWGPQRFASGMKQAVDVALNHPSPARWIDRLILSMACR